MKNNYLISPVKGLALLPLLLSIQLNVKATTVNFASTDVFSTVYATMSDGDVLLLTTPGSTAVYTNLESITLTKSITIMGDPTLTDRPILRHAYFIAAVDSNFVKIEFNNLEAYYEQPTEVAIGKYFLDARLTATHTITTLKFKDCYIHGYGRSLVRADGGAPTFTNVVIDNCLFYDFGRHSASYPILGVKSATTPNISITNTTFYNCPSYIIQHNNGSALTFTMDRCNILDMGSYQSGTAVSPSSAANLFTFQTAANAASVFTISNSIIAGTYTNKDNSPMAEATYFGAPLAGVNVIKFNTTAVANVNFINSVLLDNVFNNPSTPGGTYTPVTATALANDYATKVIMTNPTSITGIGDPKWELNPALAPTTAASSASMTAVDSHNANISWTNGNGDKRVVFGFQGSTPASGAGVPALPALTNNTTYTPWESFAGDWICLYNDAGNSFSVSGLSPNTDFYIVVFEYNGAAGHEKYLTTGAPTATAATPILTQTISGFSDITKTYGDADFNPGAVTSVGLKTAYTTGDPTVATVNAADSTIHIVGAGSCTLTAVHNGNDTCQSVSLGVTLTVNKATQTITFNPDPILTKNLGTPDFAPASSSSGLQLSYSSDNTAVATIVDNQVHVAGPGTANITASIGESANYLAATSITRELTVSNLLAQVIDFAVLPADKKYGDASFTVSATGGASGNPVTFTSLNTSVATVSGNTVTIVAAGTATIRASQAGDGVTYGAAENVDRNLVVAPVSLTVKGATGQSRVYGEANPTLNISYIGFIGTDNAESVVTSAPTVSCSATATSSTGDYRIIVSGGTVNTNYTLVYDTTVTMAVTAATLTATAASASRVYGSANPSFTLSYSGFKNSQTASVVTTAPTVTCNATASSAVGDYTLTVGTNGIAPNYTVVSATTQGKLTVTPASLTVTVANDTIHEGTTIPSTFSVSYSGFVNGETASVISGSPAFTTNATAGAAVGTYDITVAKGTLAATNYTFSFVNGHLIIVPGTLINSVADDIASLYPNPVSDKLRVVLPDPVQGAVICVYSAKGVLLNAIRSNQKITEIDMSNYDSGNYILKVIINGKTIEKQVIKL